MKPGLTSGRMATRRERLGGHDARVIMSGDDASIYNLWLEKLGKREPDDLSGVLEVVMGAWTEELNRMWYTDHTCRAVWDAGKSYDHPTHTFLSCTLDGKTTTERGDDAIFEAKHVNPFRFNLRDCIAKYQPQIQHYMMVNGLEWAILSVFVGTSRWECVELEADVYYQASLLERLVAFWQCVQTGECPVTLPTIEPPVPPDKRITVDMDGSNEWAYLAVSWLETRQAMQMHESSERGLKALVPREAGLAHGHGIEIKRNAKGHLSLKQQEG